MFFQRHNYLEKASGKFKILKIYELVWRSFRPYSNQTVTQCDAACKECNKSRSHLIRLSCLIIVQIKKVSSFQREFSVSSKWLRWRHRIRRISPRRLTFASQPLIMLSSAACWACRPSSESTLASSRRTSRTTRRNTCWAAKRWISSPSLPASSPVTFQAQLSWRFRQKFTRSARNMFSAQFPQFW